MARIRTVKPALFRHYELYLAEKETKLPLRLSWIGLFTVCDREGRFKWRPEELKPDVLPYDSGINFERVLVSLAERGFVQKYEVDGKTYGCIPSWREHQIINNKEALSVIPSPTCARVSHEHPDMLNLSEGEEEGKGREEEGKRKGREGKNKAVRAPSELCTAAVGLEDLQNVFAERLVKTDLQRSWLDAFPEPDWILQEIKKALSWELANPGRKKKNFGAFVTRWLTNGWDKRKLPLRSVSRAEVQSSANVEALRGYLAKKGIV